MLSCCGVIYTSMLVLLLGAGEPVTEKPKLGFMLGFKGGLSTGSYWGDGVSNFESDLSASVNNLEPRMLLFFTSSFFIEYQLVPDFLAIEPELLFFRTGKSWNAILSNNEEIDIKLYTDYMNIPLNVKLLIPLYPVVLGVYSGPSIFIRMQSRAQNISRLPPEVNRGFLGSLGSNERISGRVNPLDFGLSTGFTLDYILGTSRLIFDLKYNFGFFNVYKASGGNDIRNSVFTVTAGYGWSY